MSWSLGSLKGLYRVDNVPWLIRPWFLLCSYTIGTIQFYLLHVLVHLTARIDFVGEDPRKNQTCCIYGVWHGEVFAFFTAFRRIPNLAVINHPLWYMKPIHVMLFYFGAQKIFLGSTGHGGRAAVEQLAEVLASGKYSTLINPDGPAGPAKEVKKGILHLSAQTGLPIVPVSISAIPSLRLKTWDGKFIPLPFSRMTVVFGKPIFVKPGDVDSYVPILKRELSASK